VSHDVLILGAGPAGSVTARRLAAAGARVLLVGGPSRPSVEGLSARSRALLDEEDLPPRGPDGAAVLHGPVHRGGEWAGRAVAGTEWLAERGQLAAALRGAARQAGAECRDGVVLHAARDQTLWRVQWRGGGRAAAPILVDARGRRGPERRGPLLLAYGRRFRLPRPCADAPARAAGGSQIHALDEGWCWLAAQGASLWVQVVSRPRRRHPAAWIAAAVAQVPALARALEGAVPDGAAVARPAHARRGLGCADQAAWRVGDAALALDPLSGQGVYEALRGARLVATAVQSVLNGTDARLAQRFVAERQEEAWLRGVRAAAGFYRENAQRSAFWREAAAGYQALLPALQGANRIERRPVLQDGRIVERDVIVTAAHPRGVWHVSGVPLVSLKGYLESADCVTVAGAAAALERPAASVAAAIHWLQQTGIVARQLHPGLVGRLNS
jgi:flavin-dependent dehydrogenase